MATKTITNPGQKIDAFDVNAFDWDTETAQAHSVAGADLAKDELADELVGVPFMIHRLVFRPGLGVAKTVVSCEAVVAPEHVMKRRRVRMDECPFEPGSQIVFNDGSTGIYRQLVNYLNAAGFITVKDGPEEGPSGESRYDVRPTDGEIHAGEVRVNDDGSFRDYTVNIRLTCPRGLRLSEYVNDSGDSKTRYIG